MRGQGGALHIHGLPALVPVPWLVLALPHPQALTCPPPACPPHPSGLQIFIGLDPSKPALRTEGLLPADTIIDIVTKELLAAAPTQ